MFVESFKKPSTSKQGLAKKFLNLVLRNLDFRKGYDILTKKEKKGFSLSKGKHKLNIEPKEMFTTNEELENRKSNHHHKKGKKEKSEKQIKRSRKIKLIFLIVLMILIVVFGIWLAIDSYHWKTLATQMINNKNSLIIDTSGKTIAELGSEKKKIPISLSEMPEELPKAYVAIEDERYESHHGVDIKRTGSAILSYVFHGGSSSFGGSTITQQLVKNFTGDNTDSIFRKVKEWWKAWQIEGFLSKDEILTAYLNIIYVGPNIYGVEAGAKYYFQKQAADLNLAECAFLAGINHSPNSYNPFNGSENTDKIKKRTKTVLAKMLELKDIDQTSYDQAILQVEKGLSFRKGSIDSSDGIYSYHTDQVINEITYDLAEKEHISTTFASNFLSMAGLTISSTQDSSLQKQTEDEMAKTKYSLSSKQGQESAQSAMIILDSKTGQVVSCVGGLGEKKTSRGLNRATQSVRQTGSAIKPLAVLAPGIDRKKFTASSLFDDTPTTFANEYAPKNYSQNLGEITVRRAVESSQNIPFVEMMEKITPHTAVSYLKKMGITTLTKQDESLALSLGGLEKGISPLEMAGAYQTIANDGIYVEPIFYTKIVTIEGKTILERKPKTKRVFSKEVAYILKQLLTQPVKGGNGTATYCSLSGIDVAAKTGTTDDDFDRWLCGFTPYYTAVTWFGFDQNETIEYWQKNPAGIIWANVMRKAHANLSKATFEKPNGISTHLVCSETGEKARSGCPTTYEEFFLWGTAPKLCTKHSGSEAKENSNKTTNTNNSTSHPNANTTNNELELNFNDTSSQNNMTSSKENTNTEQNNVPPVTNQNQNNNTTNTNHNSAINHTTASNSTNTSSSNQTTNTNATTENHSKENQTNQNTTNNINTNSSVEEKTEQEGD